MTITTNQCDILYCSFCFFCLIERFKMVCFNKTFTGRFNFIVDHSGLSCCQKTVTINQRVEFQAISANEKSIDDLLEYIITFQNFLALALYKSTYPLSISLSGERHKKDYGDGETYKKTIKLYFSSQNFKTNEKPKFDFEMIFDYGRIQSDFQRIIKKSVFKI